MMITQASNTQLNLAIEALSERQKACLRLVLRGMTSKEIALETGLTPQTVDTYLKASMSRLKASSRRDAARRLAEYEASQRLGSPSPRLADRHANSDPEPTAGAGGWAQTMRPPPLGGSLNTLSGQQRTFAVLKVAAMALAAVLSLTLVLAGMFQTFRLP